MPIYEYRCEACGEISEHFLRSRSEQEPTTCKHCSAGPLERLISRSAFHLKGNGWYTTDYKPTGGAAAPSSADASSAPAASSETSGSKPADASPSSDKSSSPSTSSSGGDPGTASAA